MGKTDNDRNPWRFRKGIGRYLRRQYWKTQRQREREAADRRQTPEPSRHRHGVKYDYW